MDVDKLLLILEESCKMAQFCEYITLLVAKISTSHLVISIPLSGQRCMRCKKEQECFFFISFLLCLLNDI